jgi:hypothetical protein
MHCWSDGLAGAPRDVIREAAQSSQLDLLRQHQRVIDLDPEITQGALQLCASEKHVDRSQIAGLAIDLRRLGAPHITVCFVQKAAIPDAPANEDGYRL